MTARRFLSFQGNDVAPIARAGDKAVLVYLDRFGRPTSHTAEAWPHQLVGRHWHLATIKQLLALLPESPSAASPSHPAPHAQGPAAAAAAGASPTPGRRSSRAGAGGFLHAHYSLPPGSE